MEIQGVSRTYPRGGFLKSDRIRLKRYLSEITRNSKELSALIKKNELLPGSIELKAAKYILIELAEGISNTIQHILAKEEGVAVSGYIDTLAKGYQYGLFTKELFDTLKPFFDFRNSLIHRYWTIDDSRLIENIIQGRKDFERFVSGIETYLEKLEITKNDEQNV